MSPIIPELASKTCQKNAIIYMVSFFLTYVNTDCISNRTLKLVLPSQDDNLRKQKNDYCMKTPWEFSGWSLAAVVFGIVGKNQGAGPEQGSGGFESYRFSRSIAHHHMSRHRHPKMELCKGRCGLNRCYHKSGTNTGLFGFG